jgi:hypothetical protein
VVSFLPEQCNIEGNNIQAKWPSELETMELFGQFRVISATVFSLGKTYHNKPNSKRNHLPSSIRGKTGDPNLNIKLQNQITMWSLKFLALNVGLWLISTVTNNFFPVTVTILVINIFDILVVRTHTLL